MPDAGKRFSDLFEARERLSPAELRFERRRRTAGLFLGPLAFVALLLLPPAGLTVPAARLTALLAWVLIWWVTEAVPIPVTSLLGPVLGVLLGVGTASELFAGFGDPVILFFLGSFIIAEAMTATGLGRRLAYGILARPWVGVSTTRLLLAFSFLAGGLSMWISDTATTAMIYPIAMSVLGVLAKLLGKSAGREVEPRELRYGVALLLVISYSSLIGGIGTPIGTPPNLIAIGLLEKLAGEKVAFFSWMSVAVPVTLLLLVVLVVYLRLALPPECESIEGGQAFVTAERAALGPWTAGQRNVLGVFLLAVALWVLPGVLSLAGAGETPFARLVQRALPESVVALGGALLLFVLPTDWAQRRFTITWNEAVRVDWGTLLLFGGGLSLGGAMFRTGLAAALGRGLVELTGAQSEWAITYLFSTVATLLTETTSNTASATMVCPLAIAAARAAGRRPIAPAIATALSASMAFLLPVSTGSNAIIYGSGCVPITAMLRHGGVLDLLALAIVPAAVLTISGLVGLR
jgi:sodium-dependent dicarboxylate transporter 2/3/5